MLCRHTNLGIFVILWVFPYSLKTIVTDLIFQSEWCVPVYLNHSFPQLTKLLQAKVISVFDFPDCLLWKNTGDGKLTFKNTDLHYSPTGQSLSWCKTLWSKFISPSKYLLL